MNSDKNTENGDDESVPHIPLQNSSSGTRERDDENVGETRSDESADDPVFITANSFDRDKHSVSRNRETNELTHDDIERSVYRGEKIVHKIPNHDTFHDSSKNIFWGRVQQLLRDTNRDDPQYDSIVLTDTDPDGKGVAALLEYEHGDSILPFPASYRYGIEPLEALTKLSPYLPPGMTVYICDIGPNEEMADEWIRVIDEIQESNPVRFRDHHERVDVIYDAFDDMDNVEYVLDPSVCATMIVLREDVSNPSRDMIELAAITNVQDIHIPESPHFDEYVPSLRVASRALSFAVYVEHAKEHGIDFLTSETYRDYFETYRDMMRTQEDIVLETMDEIIINGYRVGFLYGNSHPDRPAEVLKQEHGCDIVLLLKPNGRMSIRSDITTAPFSNEIAELFDGGGHTDSAGCVVFDMYKSEPEIDPDEHFDTRGAKQREVVENAVREFLMGKPSGPES